MRHPLPEGFEEAAVAKRKLSDDVLERVLKLIQNGTFSPSDQLPSERELMAAFHVGRPAVREALQSLQQMGLISISHGERARVIECTPSAMFDQIRRSAKHLLSTSPQNVVYLEEARLMFEVAMVRRAAANATEENLTALRTAVDKLAAARSGAPQFLAADMEFHEAIGAVSGNPFFAAISRAMLEWLAHLTAGFARAPGQEEVTVNEHRAILERIVARDPEGAAQAMQHHLKRASHLYRGQQSNDRNG